MSKLIFLRYSFISLQGSIEKVFFEIICFTADPVNLKMKTTLEKDLKKSGSMLYSPD